MTRLSLRTTLLAGVALGVLGAAAAQAQAIRSGFDSNTLAPNDDGSTGLVDIGFEVNFFGVEADQLYVNNNGNVTFDSALGTFTPFDLTSTGQQIIAPFFADVDTRNAGDPVTYGQGTVDGNAAFAVNYVNVDYFSSDPSHTNRNSFQVVLIDQGDGNFAIEFNYDQIEWEAGTASGGDEDGLGGDSARVGFSNGSGDPGTFFELEGSAENGAFLDGGPNALVASSRESDVPGRYIFFAEGGIIIIDTGSDLGALATESAISLTQAQSDDLWKLSRRNRAARAQVRRSEADSAMAGDGTSTGRFSVWARAGGAQMNADFGGDLDVSHFIAQAGLEYALSEELALGLSLGGARTDARTARDSLDGEAMFLSPYVSYGRGPLSAVGSLIYTYTDYDEEDDAVEHGHRFATTATVGYDVATRGSTTLTPFGYAAGGVERLDTAAGDDEAGFFIGRAGVEVSHALALGGGSEGAPAAAEVFGTVAAEYVSGDAPDDLGPTTLADYDSDRLGGRVEAGFSYSPVNSPMSVFASAASSGVFTDATSYGGRVGLSVPF
ncbi:MAG: nidogen-like domain-containing protein [Pseudomonadota bacterium]